MEVGERKKERKRASGRERERERDLKKTRQTNSRLDHNTACVLHMGRLAVIFTFLEMEQSTVLSTVV